MKFLEFDEMTKLENYAYDHCQKTGLRFGKVAVLHQSDVDYKNKELSITKSLDKFRNERAPKTKKVSGQ